MVGYATELELDTASRVLLPNLHRDYALIGKRIMLVGQGHKFEIWSEESWRSITETYLTEPQNDKQNNDFVSLSI